jgi:tetratricopeptide (TPR) repeat protein
LLGYIQRRQGRWEQCLVTLEEAFKLDPRSPQLAYEIGITYLALRRYEEAEDWFNQALAIDPNRLTPLLGKITISVLSRGMIEEARAQLETLPNHPLADYMGITLSMLARDYQKVLDKLSSLTYDFFQEQHFYFHKDLTYAAVYHAQKKFSLARNHADAAREFLKRLLSENPGDTRYHAALGLALAYSGRKEEAVQEGERAVNLHPVSRDVAQGPIYVLNLARIFLIVGEYNKAMQQLEYLLSIPSCEYLWQVVSETSLQIDPLWDPVRAQPRFQSLVEDQP